MCPIPQRCKHMPFSISMAIPHNSKCRYGERGAADAKPKAQIILDAAKVSAASGGNSEPKQGQRSQSARGFCPRSTMRVPQPDIIEHFGNADAVPQPPKRCLSRKAGKLCGVAHKNAEISPYAAQHLTIPLRRGNILIPNAVRGSSAGRRSFQRAGAAENRQGVPGGLSPPSRAGEPPCAQ